MIQKHFSKWKIMSNKHVFSGISWNSIKYNFFSYESKYVVASNKKKCEYVEILRELWGCSSPWLSQWLDDYINLSKLIKLCTAGRMSQQGKALAAVLDELNQSLCSTWYDRPKPPTSFSVSIHILLHVCLYIHIKYM